MRVVVWNEHRVEQQPEIAVVYPLGIHGAVADALRGHDVDEVATATLDEPDQGLPAERLDYPTYHHPAIRRLLANAVRWAAAGAG
jgi:trehalose utilization protein